jgi:hypothetical protein
MRRLWGSRTGLSEEANTREGLGTEIICVQALEWVLIETLFECIA